MRVSSRLGLLLAVVISCLGATAFVAGLHGIVTARGDEVRAPAPEPVGMRRALIICGLPGDDEHRTMYAAAVSKIVESLTGRCGFPASEVWVRFGSDARSEASFGPTSNRGPAERAGIEADVAELRPRLAPEDALWVIVLGHGHYDGRHSHLNLAGPDLDERDFARIFAGLKAREQVFVITTSASGFFLKPLTGPGRVVITATEPDREVNETLFPMALADVLATPPPEADRDKDGALSLLELYLAVVIDVLKRYAAAERSDRACPARRQRRRPRQRGATELSASRAGRFGRRRRGRRKQGRSRGPDRRTTAHCRHDPRVPTLRGKPGEASSGA